MKKMGIGAAIVGVMIVIIGIILKTKENASVSIIGGADGPTSIFISDKVNVGLGIAGIAIGIILCIIGITLCIIGMVIIFKKKNPGQGE
ncbi:hypothetical protein [Anaerobium acetethylicum]|uniref:Oxaloacetate decarboxylase n=1 Tax=Anaerobium acetethylicum TaxID=1619234 RepID=A0A1D3TUI0_9FIRM|nr:hypothetical protein [Anaerobium acetethylicum]SCP97734.1 hypothetical protein SAMN05421730_101341 [Anaerobium acetethylicum]